MSDGNDALTPAVADSLRRVLADMLRAAAEDVSEEDVAGCWGRFEQEEVPGLLARHPLSGAVEDHAGLDEWIRAIHRWVHCLALEEALRTDPAHASALEVRPDGTLAQGWFKPERPRQGKGK